MATKVARFLTGSKRNRTPRRGALPRNRSLGYDEGALDDAIGWEPSAQTADGAIYYNIDRIRARARHLARENDYARHFIRLAVSNIVGPNGIRFQATLKFTSGKNAGKRDETFNSLIEDLYRKASKTKNKPTVDGRRSMRKALAHMVRSLIVDGEILILFRPGSTRNVSGLQFQFIDPARLDWRLNEKRGDNLIKMGVEFDPDGEVVAYHILERNPYDIFQSGKQLSRFRHERIAAQFIRHVFIDEFTDQSRGVTLLASASLRAHLIDRFEKATVVGGIVAASKMGFYMVDQEAAEDYGLLGQELSETGEQCEDVNDDAVLSQTLVPGTMEQLPSWVRDVKNFDPQYPPANFEEFEKRMIRGMASGFGIQYHALANDLSDVNFSSSRTGENHQRDVWREFQKLFVEEFLEFHIEWWLRMLMLQNVNGLDNRKLSRVLEEDAYLFQGRGWQHVDPRNEMQGHMMAVQLGITSRRAIIAEMGGQEWPDLIEEMKQERVDLETAGIDPEPWKKGVPEERPSEGDDDEEDEDS